MIKFRENKGFTIIELVIVMMVIAILASIAIPIYNTVKERAYTVEAKYILKHIWGLELEYYSSNNAYSKILDDIGFVKDSKYKYTYEITQPGNNDQFFEAKASLDINNDGTIDDVWQVNVSMANRITQFSAIRNTHLRTKKIKPNSTFLLTCNSHLPS